MLSRKNIILFRKKNRILLPNFYKTIWNLIIENIYMSFQYLFSWFFWGIVLFVETYCIFLILYLKIKNSRKITPKKKGYQKKFFLGQSRIWELGSSKGRGLLISLFLKFGNFFLGKSGFFGNKWIYF